MLISMSTKNNFKHPSASATGAKNAGPLINSWKFIEAVRYAFRIIVLETNANMEKY